jgi:hypothetical protein
MFERYSEEARRSLFFARYEATQTGNVWITPEDLLLGIARERLGESFGPDGVEKLRTRLAAGPDRPLVSASSASHEIPFAATTKRVLYDAARLADEHQHKWIGPEHLMAAIATSDGEAAAALREFDLTPGRILADVRAPDAPGAQMGAAGRSQVHAAGLGMAPLFVEAHLRAHVDELFIATDQKHWMRARQLFADGPIEVDMSSLAGGAAVTTTADELIAGFRVALHQGKASHHMVSNHKCTVRLEQEEADVFCHGYAWNQVAAFPSSENLWETWGTYDFTLKLSAGEWRITAFRYVSKLTRGNDAVRTHLSES